MCLWLHLLVHPSVCLILIVQLCLCRYNLLGGEEICLSCQLSLRKRQETKFSHTEWGPYGHIRNRAECLVNKSTLTTGREQIVLNPVFFSNCVENYLLPSPGNSQFVHPAFHLAFKCVHGRSWQHLVQVQMASWLRFRAL